MIHVCNFLVIFLTFFTPSESCVKKLKGCSLAMKVNWIDLPPYVFAVNDSSSGNGTVNGTLKYIIEGMVRRCCGQCVQFDYLEPMRNFKELIADVNSLKNKVDLSFPVYGKNSDLKFNYFPYYPIIETPGVLFLRNRLNDGTATQAITSAVISGWPIMVLCLVFAGIAGIIINLLDSYWNPAHFPSPFYKGSWEGFWWAFVTMTTVGYGDRAPRSFHARAFSFFWALLGLTILGLFTGTVSSALTSFSLSKEAKIFGRKIVVINETEEHRYAIKNSAEIIIAENIDDFLKKIEKPSPNVDGSLIDSYVAGYNKDKIEAIKGIEFSKIFDYQFTYGFVFTQILDDPRLPKCLRKEINESSITQSILQDFSALMELNEDDSSVVSKKLIDSRSDIYLTVIYVCIGSIIILLISGVAWEHLYALPKKRKNEKSTVKELTRATVLTAKDSFLDVSSKQCRELEDFLVSEVSSFYETFMNKIGSINSSCN